MILRNAFQIPGQIPRMHFSPFIGFSARDIRNGMWGYEGMGDIGRNDPYANILLTLYSSKENTFLQINHTLWGPN